MSKVAEESHAGRQSQQDQIVQDLQFCPDLWYIFGTGYDLSSFLSKHPGGKTALLMGKGRDCTNIVRTYHLCDTSFIISRLQKYKTSRRCDALNDYQGLAIHDEPFHADIKALVNNYRRTSNSIHMRKSHLVAIVCCFFLTILLLYQTLRGSVIASLTVPFTSWFLFINAHNAAHFSCFRYPLLNRLMLYLSCPLYVNTSLWLLQHSYSHHQYVNDPDRDVDLHHTFGYVRMAPDQPWRSFMAYLVHSFVYMNQLLFSSLAETIVFPFMLLVDYALGTNILYGCIPNKSNIVRHFFSELVVEVFLSIAFLLAPFLRHENSFWKAYVLGVLPFHISSVLQILGIQFNHLTEATSSTNNKLHGMGEEFPITSIKRQVVLSLDIQPTNVVTTFLLGGLNQQSLHHVVPGVHSSHFVELYPAFARICERHRVQINSADSVLKEFVSYARHMCNLNLNQRDNQACKRRASVFVMISEIVEHTRHVLEKSKKK